MYICIHINYVYTFSMASIAQNVNTFIIILSKENQPTFTVIFKCLYFLIDLVGNN